MLFLIIILLAVLCYLLLTKGRTGHPGLAELSKFHYAHRGLHGHGVPENSLAAFCEALERGYGIELDIHLMADGNLAVIHDSLLKRTTGREGRIEELNTAQLGDCFLEGTTETIPEFSQVLNLFSGKAPLIVELKTYDSNYAPLCEAACRMLDGYDGAYCIESFDPRCIHWLKKHRPDVIRGQLSENSLHLRQTKVPYLLRFAMTYLLSNGWNRPDFIAYRFENRQNISVKLSRKLWGVQGVSWTLRCQEDFDMAVKEGWIPIFEGFIPKEDS